MRRAARVAWLVAWLGAMAGASGACCPAGARPRAATGTPRGRRVVKTMTGLVTYYHDSLAGNHTANGEVYDPRRLTAAHRTLPFGTWVRVTRLDNGRSVVVRVNDRGPFGRRRRIMDLSRAAAERLDMIRAGVVKAKLEVLE